MSEKEILECFNELGVSDFCDNYYGLHIIQAIQGLLDLYEKEKEKNIYLTQELETRKWVKVKENGEVEPAFYISKDKIRNLILKYRCFGWHDKDDEYWANRILDGFEKCLEEE